MADQDSPMQDHRIWTARSHATPNGHRVRQHRGRQQLLDWVDRLISAWGPVPRRLSAAELIDQAVRRTGLTDFGDGSFEEPLRVLIKSYEVEACLSVFGRMAARWDALRFLSNLLLLRSAEAQAPAILNQSIERPIFVTGMPRSGTTFLHNLFAQDQSNLFVRCWETIYPCPMSSGRLTTPDRRAAKVDRHLDAFAKLAPDVRRVHPLTAQSPQECTEITGHVFRSLRFDTTHHVPSYRLWLDDAGHLAAYRFHRRFLKYLQHHKGPGRWVLKCPDHVFALDAIREIYPDACYVFMHRNPLEVLPSAAELTEILRRPFTRSIDRLELGRQVSERWAHGADILVDEAARTRDLPHVAHLDFRGLVGDPVRTMAELYERFGLKFGDEFAMPLRQFITEWPDGGYRRDKTPSEEYGLGTEAERRRYRDYIACYGL